METGCRESLWSLRLALMNRFRRVASSVLNLTGFCCLDRGCRELSESLGCCIHAVGLKRFRRAADILSSVSEELHAVSALVSEVSDSFSVLGPDGRELGLRFSGGAMMLVDCGRPGSSLAVNGRSHGASQVAVWGLPGSPKCTIVETIVDSLEAGCAWRARDCFWAAFECPMMFSMLAV